MDLICDVAELERTVGKRSMAVMLKSVDALDAHCAGLLALAPVAVLGCTDVGGRARARLVGGAPGFAEVAGPTRLRLPVPDDAAPGSPASLLVLVPGWRESLRINGHLVDGEFEVGEAFVHCAKAVLRSGLWNTAPDRTGGGGEGTGPLDGTARAFLTASPFLAITSQDAAGGADASPKGDPAGFVRVLDDGTVAMPDRPGNRRTDTLHNVLDRPEVGIVALVPGDDRTLELGGTARPVRDAALLAAMAVRDRTPKAALVVDVQYWRLAPSPALRASRLWDPAGHVPTERLPAASRIWADHVRANRTAGLAARAARALVNERVLRAGAEIDYRTNMY